jgi:predicted AlkP superfamily phosphohydrolase/phosphomutase
MNSTGTLERRPGPLVVLGLDAFEVDWLHRWSGEGRLPFLTALMKHGVFGRVRSSAFSDAPWPSLVSGVSPGEHAFYTHLQLQRGTHRVERIDARHSRRRPFWHRLRHADLRLALLDVPKTFPIQGVPGIQICGWGEHYPLLQSAESIPGEAIGDLIARFGAYPHADEVTEATREYEESCARTFIENVARKANAIEYLLGIGKWDFFFAVFAEVHYADHQLLHLSDESHWAYEQDAPPSLREALPDTATKLDAALAGIHERLPPDANLVLLSVHGIEPNFSGNAMVPEFLRRLGVFVPRAAEVPSNVVGSLLLKTRRMRELIPRSVRDFINTRLPDHVHDRAMASEFEGSVDWRRTQVFLLPSDHFQAFLSLNLAGREPNGIVQPGSEAETLFGRLRVEFLRLVNMATGRPAVDDVQWVPSLYPGASAFELPDIVVHWSRDVPIERVMHPEYGLFDMTGQVLRKSQHTSRGFLIATGPAFIEQSTVPEIATTDVAPTLLHLLGQEPDPDMPGEVRRDLLKPEFHGVPARHVPGDGQRTEAARP